MSAATLPDYPQQLHDAIQATRNAILAERATADGTCDTALGALDISRRTFADARLALADAGANLGVAGYLDRKLVDANLTALNGVTLATASNTRATATTTAVALAATSIRAASDAVDAVTRDVNGIAGITKSNDADEPVDRAAKAAVEAVAKAARAVEQLKTLALHANIEAARPRTAAALLAAQTSQAAVAAILGTADTALAASTAAVTTAQAARTADLEDLFTKTGQFTIAARDDAALGTTVTVIDRVGNASLRVSVHNLPDGKDGHEMPGLQAICDFDLETAAATRAVRFFAVPAADVASFDFEAAHKSSHHTEWGYEETHRFPKKDAKAAYTAVLRKDTDGHVIRYGQSYCIFFLRLPRHGAPRATDFSFATPPITSTVLLTFPAKPVIFPLINGTFVTAFVGTDHPESVASYQLFYAPTDVYEKGTGEELLVAGTLTAASFTTVDAKKQSCTHPAATLHALRAELLEELKVFGRVPKEIRESIEQALKPLEKWLGESHGGTAKYVTYFSPFSHKAGWQKEGGYSIGRYTDMYGDLFDLDRRAYYALALATGVIDRRLLQQAANVLSPASSPFPSQIVPAALPPDESSTRKPAKK